MKQLIRYSSKTLKSIAAFGLGVIACVIIPFALAFECFKTDEWPWEYM